MDLKQIIEPTRNLIREGETGKALQTLLGFLEQDPAHTETARTLSILEANYNAARKQESKGILTFQDAQRSYSQVNDALLEALDALEAGRRPKPVAGDGRSSKRLWVIIGAAILVLGAVAAVLFFQKKNSATVQGVEIDCPEFTSPGRKILLLPFTRLSGEEAKAERYIQERISLLAGNNNFALSAEVGKTKAEDINPILARKLGQTCGADMVIWGVYEKNGDNLMLKPSFVFVNNYGPDKKTGVLNIAGLVDLQNNAKFRSFDDAVLALCGVMALYDGNKELAQKWYEKVKEPSLPEQRLLDKMHNPPQPAGPLKELREKRKTS